MGPQPTSRVQPRQEATEGTKVERDRLGAIAQEVLEDDGSSAQLGNEDARDIELDPQRLERPVRFEEAQGTNLASEALNTKRVLSGVGEDSAFKPAHQYGGRDTFTMNAQQVSVGAAGETLRALRVTERPVDESDRLR